MDYKKLNQRLFGGLSFFLNFNSDGIKPEMVDSMMLDFGLNEKEAVSMLLASLMGFDIIDNEEDGNVCGEIISIIYKGDHYQVIIRTENYDDFVCDTQWTWNEYDKVSVKIPKEKIKLTLKQEVKKYVKD